MLDAKSKAVLANMLHNLAEATGDRDVLRSARALLCLRGGRPQRPNNKRLICEAIARLADNAHRPLPLSETQVLKQVAKDLAPYEKPKVVAERIRRHLAARKT